MAVSIDHSLQNFWLEVEAKMHLLKREGYIVDRRQNFITLNHDLGQVYFCLFYRRY